MSVNDRETEREREMGGIDLLQSVTYARNGAVVEQILHHHEVLFDCFARAAVVDRVHSDSLCNRRWHAVVVCLGNVLCNQQQRYSTSQC
jgi:hypothetical protein